MMGFVTLFGGLLASGMPVFLVLGLCAGIMFILSGQPLVGLAQLVINEFNSPVLMSLPLFVMAATFMRSGGIANALVNLASAWLGGLPGSLGLVTVVACTLFAAICGSSVATALAMGTILIPAMLERGYPRSFVLGVVGASGTIGIVIPPSFSVILYGIVAEKAVPRPVTISTRVVRSSRTRKTSCSNSSITSRFMQLRRSGRLNVIMLISPAVSKRKFSGILFHRSIRRLRLSPLCARRGLLSSAPLHSA